MSLSLVKPIVSMAPNAVQSWRWIHIVVAALLMVPTLPGRTHGLGLFTEPILRTFALTRDTYGFINLWATLIGATFCFPCGWFTDRIGTRAVAVVVDPVQSVKGKVMIDAFRSIDPQVLMMGIEPR
jgi:hypothetical protein